MYKNFRKFRKYAGCPPTKLLQALSLGARVPKPATVRAVRRLLLKLRRILDDGPGTVTKSFQQSRFTPVAAIWRKKQRSCGSYTTVVTSVMRYLGLPCKLIDGYLGIPKEGHHHAWNEIWISAEQKFIPFDITRKSLRVGVRHRRRRAYHDWSELEKERK